MVNGKTWLIAIVGSFWISAAFAQSVGGPAKPQSHVGGPMVQGNPVVPFHRGTTPKPPSPPKK